MNQESSQARLDRKAIEEIINETKELFLNLRRIHIKIKSRVSGKLEQNGKKWIYGISSVIGMLLLVAVLYGTMRGFDDLKPLFLEIP